MAGELSQRGAERGLQAALGVAVAGTPSYLALATATPANPDTADLAAWGSVELSDAGYARQTVSWTTPTGDPSQVSNSNVITFGPFSGDPPQVTHCFLCTAASGTTGEVLAWWQLTAAKDPGSGDSLQFDVGDLTMSLD